MCRRALASHHEYYCLNEARVLIFPQSFRRYLLDRIVLRPSRDELDCGTQQRMELSADGQTIEYFVQPFGDSNQPHDLIVLKFPGTGGRAERSTAFPGEMLDGVSGVVLTWNPPGYGRSSGRPSLAKMTTAAKFFVAEAIDRHASGATVWLCGNSLGCSVVLSIAADDKGRRIGGVVLRNPPPLILVVKRVALKYPMGKYISSVAESLVHEMNAEKTAPKAIAPAVFLKSMSDTLVPPELQDQLIGLYGGCRQIVPMEGLDHDGIPTEQHQQLIAESLVWLWQQRSNSPVASLL